MRGKCENGVGTGARSQSNVSLPPSPYAQWSARFKQQHFSTSQAPMRTWDPRDLHVLMSKVAGRTRFAVSLIKLHVALDQSQAAQFGNVQSCVLIAEPGGHDWTFYTCTGPKTRRRHYPDGHGLWSQALILFSFLYFSKCQISVVNFLSTRLPSQD